jgi:hypothetical protein
MADPIVFVDMKKREEDERERLSGRVVELEQLKKDLGSLPSDLDKELTDTKAKLSQAHPLDPTGKAVVDPLFKAVQAEFKKTNQDVKDHLDGKLPSQQGRSPSSKPIGGVAKFTDAEKALAAVYGLLEQDNQLNGDPKRLVRAIAVARGEYNQAQLLFDAVLPILAEEGDKVGVDRMRADQWAGVVRLLVRQNIAADDDLLELRTKNALERLEGAGEDAPPSSLTIKLPKLEETEELEIVEDNLRAMQALYFAVALEDAKLFQVVEKLVELFQQGMLPLGRGTAGDFLYDYWRKAVDRLSEVERRNLYARAFGFPGGEPQAAPNREFSDLWLRFVSAVSSFRRQLTVDELLRSRVPVTVSEEHVRKSGRDLAANMSLHGYGGAFYAAVELQAQIEQAIDLLSDKEVKAAYGARDMWQVIEQVSTLELGGARNTVRARTMATAGAVIVAWLATRAKLLGSSSRLPLLDLQKIRSTLPRPPGADPLNKPDDRDLVEACEQWLAVTGTPDDRVEEYAQPSESPMISSGPIRIPAVAADLLASVGVQPNGYARS